MKALLLDGIWANGNRYRGLQRELATRGVDSAVFRYDATGLTRFERLADRLADAVTKESEPVVAVGFSMGGLVVRCAAMLHPGLPIRRAVFLNTPHRGSWLAWALPFGAIAQMRPTDALIKRLGTAEWSVPTLAVWCPFDTMVVPGVNARWARASETACCRVPAHAWPVHSPHWRRRIAEFLVVSETD